MLRTDGLLLAYLLAREHPERRDEIRRELRALRRDSASASLVGQALIRRKLLPPQEFLRLQNLLHTSRRRCKGCGRDFVAVGAEVVKRRRCPCGKVNRVPAVALPDEPRPPAPLEGSGSRRGLPRRIGRYPVLDRIGDGGMGVIFKVQDPSSGQVVALKLLRSDASDELKLRFQREAESMARLKHPAIVQIQDVGRDGERRYFTMELVEGQDLHAMLPSLRRSQLLELVAVLAEGLHHAHEHGIVHRDVKPHNVMLTADGVPKLADFGLSRDLGRSSLTEMGELIGTPLYMAPEQLRGDPSLIGPHTDIYALGVVLYEGLAGRLPIEANSFVELQQKLIKTTPPPPSRLDDSVPPALDRIVMRAMEKEPGDRYPNARAFAADLRAFLEGEDVPGAEAPRRRRLLDVAGSPLVLGLLALLVVGVGVALALKRRVPVEEPLDQVLVQQRENQRAEFLRRHHEARRTLTHANQALAGGDWEQAQREATACLGAARDLQGLGKALGERAPAEVTGDLAQLELESRTLLARALARGGAHERAQARELFRGLLERSPEDVDLRVTLGRLELRDGHLPAAFEQLDQALARAPDRADARYYRAEASRRLGRPGDAQTDYQQALEGGGSALGQVARPHVLAGLALAQVALGELDAAKATVAKAAGLDAADPRVRLARAALFHARGQDPEALRELAPLGRSAPDDVEVRLARAMAWARAGDQERTQEELADALGRDPNAEAYALRARLRALACEDDQAEADLAQALEHSQEGDPVRTRLRLVQARHLRVLDRPQEALDALAQALPQGAPTPADVPLLLERAGILLARGSPSDMQQAVGDADQALKLKPTSARARLLRARLALQLGDLPAAEQLLNPLPEGAAELAEALTLRLQLARRQGAASEEQEARARAAQRELLRRDPPLGLEVRAPIEEATLLLKAGRRRLARARAAKATHAGRLALAVEQLRRAATLAPWLTPARVALAGAQAKAGDTTTALTGLEEALKECPATAEACALHGRLLSGLERPKEAIPSFERALAMLAARAGDDAAGVRRMRSRLFLARARCTEQLGQHQEALLDLDTAILLAPKLVEAYQLRQQAREQAGDAAGAQQDQKTIQRFLIGYRAIAEQALAQARNARAAGKPAAGLAALEPALAAVSPEVDPARAAELHYLRAVLRLRNLQPDEGFLDLARMLELWPPSFLQLFDELLTIRQEAQVDLRAVATRFGQQGHDVDADFLAGFGGFLQVELAGARGEQEAALRGLERYLEREPGHDGALLMRATLLLTAHRLSPAMRSVTAVLEERRPPAFAHYLVARIRASQGDEDGALHALELALMDGFHAAALLDEDRYLEPVRGDTRFRRLRALADGAQWLWESEERATLVALREGPERAQAVNDAGSAAVNGLDALQPLVARGDPQGRLLAARLYLARARLAVGASSQLDLSRDLAAALEATPLVLLDWGQVLPLAEAAADVAPERFAALTPWGEELLPTRFAVAVPTLLRVLREGSAPAPDLETAQNRIRDTLERDELPGGEAWLALLSLAGGDLERAEALSARLEEPWEAPLRAWLQACLHAARSQPELALTALRQALQGGLSGPLARQPFLHGLEQDERFGALTAWATANDPTRRW